MLFSRTRWVGALCNKTEWWSPYFVLVLDGVEPPVGSETCGRFGGMLDRSEVNSPTHWTISDVASIQLGETIRVVIEANVQKDQHI